MSGVAFGTDGIRGPAGTFPIVAEVARGVGRAALAEAQDGIVLVGRDRRPSGAQLLKEVVAGIAEAGGTALVAGLAPTSALQIALAERHAGSGVMVTASHNPASDNGFKVLLRGGRKPDDVEAERIAGAIVSAEPTAGTAGSARDAERLVRETWVRAIGVAAGDLSALAGRRIAIDLANGAAVSVRREIESLVPAPIHWLGAGEGAINDGCGTEHLDALARMVQDRGLDGGFAVDGDADRCRLVDGTGTEITGDAVLWRLALHLSAQAIAVTVMSTGALESLLPGVGIVRTPVGDRYVREAMDRGKLPLGGEDSGHVLFGDHAGGDGILTGLRALVAGFSAAPDLTRAYGPFAPWPRTVRSVGVVRRPPLSSVPSLAAAERDAGARLGPGGRTLLRYSGTEPVIRILVEGADAATVAAVGDELAAAARRELA